MPNTCEHCDNAASITVVEVSGGKGREVYYCEECAPEDLPGLSGTKEVAKLLKHGAPSAVAGYMRRRPGDVAACPECGMTFAEFRQGGRLGCSHDYIAFGDAMASLLASIHRADSYTGKTPGGHGVVERGELIDELRRLRDQLDALVREERYEEAAALRDEIRRQQEDAPSLFDEDVPDVEPPLPPRSSPRGGDEGDPAGGDTDGRDSDDGPDGGEGGLRS